MVLLHPPNPRRAKTRPLPGFVLGSSKFSTYPWVRAGLGRLRVGRVKYWYASGFASPAASLLGKERVLARLGREGEMGHFEHPEGYPAC